MTTSVSLGASAGHDAVSTYAEQLLLLTVLRPGCLIVLFVAGWAMNVFVFTRARVDYALVLGLNREELARPKNLVLIAGVCSAVLGGVRLLSLRNGVSPEVVSAVLLTYVAGVAFLWLPLPKAFARKVAAPRVPLRRALWRSIWPCTTRETPFIEVVVADGLTSAARVFFDLAFCTCVLNRSVQATQMVNLVQGEGRESLDDVLDQCSRSIWPFLFWALPSVIRARQCIITARCTTDGWTRKVQLANLLKYMSAWPVVACSFLHARSLADTSSILSPEDIEALWAFTAVVNSLFSAFWDLVFDWGLLQASPARRHVVEKSQCTLGLRPVLLYRPYIFAYHLLMVVNMFGRTLWSLRWSPLCGQLGSMVCSSVGQICEIIRRCLWNLLRVEW
eukprot:CAMPEP_0194533566 /NCGR_PEP_ID=MMETSP0253-20130528/71470_1 /TAXON_ID=2966 /ORGANISM="Noctiluca scintillans" /LENGTH=390 /DNA_ID=CAMNT_0039379129 /DNA_START=16 /DNA_END=1185 /DNA_ORIENTATION=+